MVILNYSKNKIILIFTFLFLLNGCYINKYEEAQVKIRSLEGENTQYQSKLEELEVNLALKSSSYQAMSQAYETLEETFYTMTSDLVNIHRDLKLLEEKSSEILGLKGRLAKMKLESRTDMPLANRIKEQLRSAVRDFKEILRINDNLIEQLESNEIDNEALKTAIALLQEEMDNKDELINSYEAIVEKLELNIRKLSNKLALNSTSCESLMAKKDGEITMFKSKLDEINSKYSACEKGRIGSQQKITDLNLKNRELAKSNLELIDSVNFKNSIIDSFYYVQNYIPDCALAYYIIGEKSYLLANGFITRKGNKFKMNEEVIRSKGIRFNFYLKRNIDLPHTTKTYEIHATKNNIGIEVKGSQLNIYDMNKFGKHSIFAVSY